MNHPVFPRMTSKKKLSRSQSIITIDDTYINQRLKEDVDWWSWCVTVGRMSQVRLLDWQRNYNTKPSDLAGTTLALSTKTAVAWSTFNSSEVRPWVKLFLTTLPRGGDGGSGQAIRDEILHIMHRH